MTLVWNLVYWQDSTLSCAVAYWKCEAGDTVAHMEVITEIMKANEIAKEQRIIKDSKEARREDLEEDLFRKTLKLEILNEVNS